MDEISYTFIEKKVTSNLFGLLFDDSLYLIVNLKTFSMHKQFQEIRRWNFEARLGVYVG